MAYYKAERRLRRWQRAQARRNTRSRGWWEAQRKIDRLHRRTVDLRKNAQHQMTSTVVHKFQNVVIEDLNIRGLMQGKTPKAQADAGMGELKRQMIYKGEWHYCEVQLAHRLRPANPSVGQLQRATCPPSQIPHLRTHHVLFLCRVSLRRLL